MSNRLGRGTVNVSANLLREERDALGKLAVQLDRSISQIMRDAAISLIQRHDPGCARVLVEARRIHRRDILTHHSQLTLDLA